MNSIWHYPDRGTGTPDFTLGSSSQHPSAASSSSSSSRDPRFQPKLQPIPSSPGPEPGPRPRSTLIIPSPRIATEHSLTLNDQSPPLTPTSPSHLNHTKSPLLPIWQHRSPSSHSSTATEADHHSNWPSFYLLGSPPPSSSTTSPAPASASASASQRKKRTAVIHSRRRSELDHPLHFSPRRTSIYEDDNDNDDDDDDNDEDDTLLPPYHQHHLAPPPRASFSNTTATPAAPPIGTSRFSASASSPSSRSASPITMPPLFLPTNIHTSVSPCPSSSASSSSEYTRSTPALCPTRSHSITSSNGGAAGHHHPTVTRTMTPFAAFFGLRERPRRLDPPSYLDDEQHSSSSSSPSSLILGALSYHRRRRSTTTAHGPLGPPPTSPTAATASALGSRFSWSRRSRRRRGGTDDDASSAQAQAHAQHQASATVKDGNAIPWVKRSLPYLPSLIILAFIFVVSTGLVILALSSLPVQLPPVSKMVASSVSPSPLGTTHAGKAASESIAAATLPLGQTATSTTTDEVSIAYRLSHLTLADIRAVTTSLKEYARTGKAPVSFAELGPADNATTLMSSAGPAGQEVEIDVRAGPLGLGLAKLHVLLVLSALFTWKQAFTIPGSIIMNVIFGALYGTFWGTVYTSVLTAFGGLCCYMLCRPLGGLIASLPGLKKPLLAIRTALDPEAAAAAAAALGAASGDARGNASNLMPYRDEDVEESSGAAAAAAAASTSSSRPSLIHRSESMQDGALSSLASRARSRTNQWATGSGSSQTWSYLLLLRLLPIIPYGLTNIACSVLRTPILPFTVTLGLGSVPWNVLTCQVGELLEEVLSVALDVAVDAGSRAGAADQGQQGAIAGVKAIVSQVFWKRDTMFKLGLVTLASLTPVLLGRVLKGKQQTQPQQQQHHQHAASGMSTLEETAPMMVMQDRYTLRGDDHEEEEEDDGQHIYGGRIGTLGRQSMDASQQSSSLSNDGRHYVVNPLPPPPPAMGSSTAAEEMHHPPHRPWWLDVDEVTSSASE